MNTLRYRIYCLLVLAFFILNSCEKPERLPNIILIMADDLGYSELGCYGQKIIRTPNIDRLAGEGMKFTQFYAGSPVCAPSRCVLLTGKHTGHAYLRDNYEMGGFRDEEEGGQLPLPAGTNTLGSMLREKGYKTAAIGKWGLGGPGSEGVPNKQGFDYFYGYLCQKQAHNYYPTHLWENDQWDTLNNVFFMPHQRFEGDPSNPEDFEKYKGNDYSLDKMMEKALSFIREQEENPFFLYLPLTIPHLALQVPEESLRDYLGRFPDKAYLGGRSYLPHRHPRAAYAAMITRMDVEIGRLRLFLEKLELAENTIIIFTSDNGPTYGGIGGSDTEFFNSAGNLRGLKGSVYEGGIRVPVIVWWKGKVSPGDVTDHIAGFQDLMPTLAEITGVKHAPENDGISFLPLILGKEQEQHDYLYWEFPAYGGQQALRKENWKAVRQGLVKNPSAPVELYDLEKDPGEVNDISGRNTEIVKELQQLMQEARIPSDHFPFPALDADTSNN